MSLFVLYLDLTKTLSSWLLTRGFSSLFIFVAKAISARSLAISKVAEGREAYRAASFIDFIISGDDNHAVTVLAITSGESLYLPKPESST